MAEKVIRIPEQNIGPLAYETVMNCAQTIADGDGRRGMGSIDWLLWARIETRDRGQEMGKGEGGALGARAVGWAGAEVAKPCSSPSRAGDDVIVLVGHCREGRNVRPVFEEPCDQSQHAQKNNA